MPRADDLPESLRPLTVINGVSLREDALDTDLHRILNEVETRAELGRLAKSQIERMRELWDRGNWQLIHRRLVEISNELEQKHGGRLVPRLISSTLAVAQELVRAMSEFSQRRFAAAHEILAAIPTADAPRNVPFSLRMADIGQRAIKALEANDTPTLKALEQEYLGAKRDSIRQGFEFVPGLEEVGRILGDGQNEAAYKAGLAAYQAGNFADAKATLSHLGEYRDSAKVAALCDRWTEFLDCYRNRRWEEVRTLLTALSRHGEPDRVQNWRRWCNAVRRWVEVLEQMAKTRLLIEPSVPVEGEPNPYAVLGLAPDADKAAIDQVSFTLQAKPGGMQQNERTAWDALRLPQRRLVADFCAYRVAEPQRAQQVIGELLALNPGNARDAVLMGFAEADPGETANDSGTRGPARWIAQRLGADGALFLLLLKMNDAALKHCEAAAQAAPDNARYLHALGMMSAATIYAEGDELTDRTDAWQKVIYCWGAVFSDERFWHQWWVDRNEVYQIDKAQVGEARQSLQRQWLDELRSSARKGDNRDVLLQTESAGARAVAAGGGIPLKRGDRRAVLGPIGAKALGVEAELAEWVTTFEANFLDNEGWQKRVCVYFSEAGPLSTLSDAARHQDVLDGIKAVRARGGGDFELRNPGFARLANRELRRNRILQELEEQALHKLAIDAITEAPPRVADAAALWRDAGAIATELGRREQLWLEMQKVVIARAAQLQSDETVDRLERLNNANAFLEAVREALDEPGGLDGLNQALVDTYLDRALVLSNDHSDHDAARNDARRAWALTPNYPRALSSVYATTILLARSKQYAGRTDLTRALLKEADEFWKYGEQHLPGQREMVEWKAEADELLKLINEGSAIDRLKSLVSLPTGNGARSSSSDPYAEALLLEARKEYPAAIDIYKSLVERNPADQQYRTKLAIAYRGWIFHMIEQNAPQSEVQEIVDKALMQCPDSELLSDMRATKEGEAT
jgi:tetratricopeptide (TPR) repeat protein